MPAGLRLPLIKRTRHRSRRPQRHYRTAGHCRWRPVRHWSARTQHTAPFRLNRHHARHRRRGEFSRWHRYHVPRHRPRIHERVTRHHGHAAVHIPVRIRDVIHGCVPIHNDAIVNVRDPRDIHPRVSEVYVVHINAAHAVARNKYFPGRQREPSYSGSKREREVESRAAADPGHQRWRVYRPHYARSRNPQPPAACECPATIVKWSESPGFIFHPCPAPRSHPSPMSKTIRRPSCHHHSRPPAHAIARNVAPVAVLVEVFVSRHLARNVICGIRLIFSLIAIQRPIVESIFRGHLAKFVIQTIAASECGVLARHHRIGRTTAGNLAASAPHRHFRSIAVRIHIDAVIPRLHHNERHVRRVDLVGVFIIHVPDFHNQRSLRQTNLCSAVTDLEQRDARLGAEAKRRRSDVHLRPRIFVRPKIVARHQRTIEHCRDPVVFSTRLERHRSIHKI